MSDPNNRDTSAGISSLQQSVEEAVQDVLSSGINTDLNMHGKRLTQLGYPQQLTDASNKQYVLDTFVTQTGGLTTLTDLSTTNAVLKLQSNLDLSISGNPSNYKLLVENGTIAKQAINKSQLDAEALLRINGQSTLQLQIDSEQSTRISQDLNLQSQINSNTTAISNQTSGLATEVLARQNAIIAVYQDLNTESANRLQSEQNLANDTTTVQNNLTSEINSRISQGNTLQTNINLSNARTLETIPKAQASLDLNNQSITNANLVTATRFVGTLNGSAYESYPTASTKYQTLNDQTLAINTASATLGSKIDDIYVQLDRKAGIQYGVTVQNTGGDIYLGNNSSSQRDQYGIYNGKLITPTIYDSSDTQNKTRFLTADSVYGVLPINRLAFPVADVNMNNNKITNVSTPLTGLDVANKSYVDGSVSQKYSNTIPLNGITLANGNINANTNKIINLLDPTLIQDASTKNYTDLQDLLKRNKLDTLQKIQTDSPLTTDLNLLTQCVSTTKTAFTANQCPNKAFNDLAYSAIGSGSSGSSSGYPVGTVLMWLSTIVPSGWLELNGQSYSAATYPDLFAILGSTSLVDMRGRFPRGYENSANPQQETQANRGIRSYQTDSTKLPNSGWQWADQTRMNVSNGSGANGTGINGGNSGLGNATESGWQVIGGDPETRPKNTSVMFIIRASISGTSLVYGISPVVGDIDMANTYKVINAVTGSNTNDLVTKGYVDAQIATTASIPTRITNSTNSASSLQADPTQLTVVGVPLNMTSQQIRGLFAGSLGTDAVNLQQLNNGLSALTLSNITVPTGSVNLNTQKLVNLANPTNPQDAVSLSYLQSNYSGSGIPMQIRNATNLNSNLTANNLQIDIGSVNLSMNNQKIIGMANGTNNLDCVNYSQLILKSDIGHTHSSLVQGNNTLSLASNNMTFKSSSNTSNLLSINTVLSLIEESILEHDIYSYNTGLVLQKMTDTRMWQTIPLMIGSSVSTTAVSNFQINKVTSGNLAQPWAMQINDINTSSQSSGGCQFNCNTQHNSLATFNSQANFNALIQATQIKMNMTNYPYTSNSPVQIGNYSGSTNDIGISVNCGIEATSYFMLTPISSKQFKQNIQKIDISGLDDVNFISYDYNKTAIMEFCQDQNIVDSMQNSVEFGAILEDLPSRYICAGKIKETQSIILSKLKDDMLQYLISERRRMSYQIDVQQQQLMQQAREIQMIKQVLNLQ